MLGEFYGIVKPPKLQLAELGSLFVGFVCVVFFLFLFVRLFQRLVCGVGCSRP